MPFSCRLICVLSSNQCRICQSFKSFEALYKFISVTVEAVLNSFTAILPSYAIFFNFIILMLAPAAGGHFFFFYHCLSVLQLPLCTVAGVFSACCAGVSYHAVY